MAETNLSTYFADSNKFTGIVKWLDSQGIGYILPDKPSLPEVFVTPSSLSSDVIKEGDCVEFTLTLLPDYTPINSFVAIKVTPLGVNCIFCRRFGHGFWSCDQPLAVTKCDRCGLIGHFRKNCDQKLRSFFFGKKTQKRIGGKSYSNGGSLNMSWVSLFGGGGVKAVSGSGSIDCVKRKEDVKKVKEVEDCCILEFDPNYDDDADVDVDVDVVKSIVCVKKVEDVKKVEEVEDCFILEFDPCEVELDKFSNLSLSQKFEFKNDGDDDDDDVVILGEKGKVACRDYPHPRHLCANYPFKKTSHELHCKMCYCYLCDIPAPCNEWNEVFKIQGLNHCDATEESFYKRIHLNFEKRHTEGR